MPGRFLTAFIALTFTTAGLVMGGDPSGNPTIKPELGERVPVGTPYTIKWTPTTQGTVSLHLLRGPSTNVKKIVTIAENVPNSGSFPWTPAVTLEDDTTHYGIKLTVDDSDQFQYTPQFGISNQGLRMANLPSDSASSSPLSPSGSSPSGSSGTVSASPSSSPAPVTSSESASSTSTLDASNGTAISSSPWQNSSTTASSTIKPGSSATATPAKSSGATQLSFTVGVTFLGLAVSLLAFLG